MVLKRKTSGWRILLTMVLCLSLAVSFGTALADDSDDGGGNGNTTIKNPDGSVTIVTPYNDDVQVNPDGSITVKSGQIQILDPEDEPRAPLTQAEWNQRLARAAELNGAYTPTVYVDPETGNACEVEVVYMGIGRSMVKFGGTKALVNTVDLRWETDAPEDQVLAVVDTPNNGYAAMYAGKSKKTTLIKQCRTDSVVRVISTGKHWTLVDHDGTRGYVQTNSLEFFCNDHTDFVSGVVSVKGRIKGNDTANVRSRDSKCRILADFKLGTPLTVFDIIDEWAEVDIGGWHCRINSKFLTLVMDETASAE